jgi:DNA-binding HxlR family transcriptional regulator
MDHFGSYEKRSMNKNPSAKPVRGSRTGRPIMALLDLLGRRMTLRVLWELSISQIPLTFRALQAAADTNPSVLNARLRELRETGLVSRGETGYALTDAGRSLVSVLLPLHNWAESWPKLRKDAQ